MKSLDRAGSVTEERGGAVLSMGGWWPVLAGLLQEMHRTALDYLVFVPQLMGILS